MASAQASAPKILPGFALDFHASESFRQRGQLRELVTGFQLDAGQLKLPPRCGAACSGFVFICLFLLIRVRLDSSVFNVFESKSWICL
jgi:hypothetical protein